jgi:hypothetical protein
MFSSNAVFAYPYKDDDEAQMDQHAGHETHDGDDNTEDQQVDAQEGEERTYQIFWQLQLEPSLIALRATGPASITCDERNLQALTPEPHQTQPTATNLMVNDLGVTPIQADTIPMVTSTDGEQQGSSSVDPPTSTTVSPQWGAYTQEITPVDLWLAPTLLTQPQ